jgi:DNA-binding IclR family transcriptional regulator
LNRRRGFYPTRKLQMLGNAIAAKDVYLQRLQPHLAALREATAETVIVGTRQNHQVLYLDVLEGPQTIRYSAMPGDFKPLHSSAIGKALLSLEPSIVAALSHQGWLPSVTPATITRPEDLLADLRVGQARGYFMTSGENVADVTALAVPVRVDGMALGVAVAGPSHRMAPAIPAEAAALLAAAAHIQGARI